MELGEPIEFEPRPRPPRTPMVGAHVVLRPLEPAADAQPLWEATHPPLAPPGLWRYLFDGPYPDAGALQGALEAAAGSQDPLFHALLTLPDERPRGFASYLRIVPEHGVLEIGNILLGAGLARTTAATEAIYLLARRTFDERD